WVDICRNGRFLEPISNGFRTGLLGGDAPDYALIHIIYQKVTKVTSFYILFIVTISILKISKNYTIR
ncbi:hypothetical protein, partial [Dysgonomonas sp. 521]|uniref:hypothetical protein n=1 Tax=Dysgonomonas sp. 521 TaxID=2302932 RepID=UPI001C88BB09